MSERVRIGTLVATALLVYGNALFNGFTYDDFPYVLNNPSVTNPSLRGFFVATRGSNVFRPVTFGTYALNWLIGNIHALGYHLLNVLLHATVSLLLYLVLRRLLERLPQAEAISFVAALLFAVHPIHSEAVTSIAGRPELLAAAFLFWAWLLHLQDRPMAAVCCFVLALLSKESAAVFVPLLVAGDYVRGKWKPLSRYAWALGLSLVFVGVLWKVQGGRFGEISTHFLDNPLITLPPFWRILNALRVAWKYVGLQIYPATLSCEYSYNAILTYTDWRHTLPAAVAALLAVVSWIWVMWTRRAGWALAGAIYFAGFAITANILMPIGTIMGERLAYLPSAGICLLAALLWIKLADHRAELAWLMLVLVLAALGTRTVVRNRDWKTNFTLFSAALRAVPGSARAHSNMGTQYMDQGKTELARQEFQMALGIYPDLPDALEFLGLIEAREGHNSEGLALLQHALAVTRRESLRYVDRAVNLAAMLVKMGRDDQALKLLNEAIQESPGYARAWSNRAVIQYRRGEASLAASDAQTALSLDPYNSQARSLLTALNSGSESHP
jgi:Tfp pilus assembly protein PilF